MKNLQTSDPKDHTKNIREVLQELIDHSKRERDITKVNGPKAMALFETGAEVLTGLKTVFSHCEEGKEEARQE